MVTVPFAGAGLGSADAMPGSTIKKAANAAKRTVTPQGQTVRDERRHPQQP